MDNDAISRRNMLETISYVKRRVIDCRDEGRLTERQSKNVVYIADLFAELISDAPALDVAPVVRCKDCKASQPCIDDNYVWCSAWHEEVDRNGFCYKGARMYGEAE